MTRLDPVALTQELVRLPTLGGTPGELEGQDWIAEQWRRLGLDVEVWDEDPAELRADPGYPGEEVDRAVVRCAVARLEGTGGGRSLLLNGHVDVVPTGNLDDWSVAPWSGELRDGAVWGRGACDMKAGLICNLAAVAELLASGERPRGDVLLQSVVGEEDGGIGTFATLRRGHRADAAVVTEPTAGRIIVANAGALTFRLTVHGKAAHGSVRYEGVSAVERFVPVIAALQELEAKRNVDPDPLIADREIPYCLSIGTVHAGEWASTVPDRLVAEGRLGVVLDEDPADARAQLEAALAGLDVDVEWVGGQFASGRLPGGHPLLDVVQEALGTPWPVAAGPYGSDLRLLAAAGIPTLHVGPGDVRLAHAPDERVPVVDIERCTRLLADVIRRWCS